MQVPCSAFFSDDTLLQCHCCYKNKQETHKLLRSLIQELKIYNANLVNDHILLVPFKVNLKGIFNSKRHLSQISKIAREHLPSKLLNKY